MRWITHPCRRCRNDRSPHSDRRARSGCGDGQFTSEEMTFMQLVAAFDKLNALTGRKFTLTRIGETVSVEARDPGKVYCGFLGSFENASNWIDGVITGCEIGKAKAEKASEEELLLMTHAGVSIYHTYIHGNEQDPLSDWWYSTQNDGDPDTGWAFDIRDLEGVPDRDRSDYEQLFRPDDVNREEKMVIAYAIDKGSWQEYARS